jgi:hypothetical protein
MLTEDVLFKGKKGNKENSGKLRSGRDPQRANRHIRLLSHSTAMVNN